MADLSSNEQLAREYYQKNPVAIGNHAMEILVSFGKWLDKRPAHETSAPTTPMLAVFWREVIKAADSLGLKKGMGLDVSLGWDVIEAARHATRSSVEPRETSSAPPATTAVSRRCHDAIAAVGAEAIHRVCHALSNTCVMVLRDHDTVCTPNNCASMRAAMGSASSPEEPTEQPYGFDDPRYQKFLGRSTVTVARDAQGDITVGITEPSEKASDYPKPPHLDTCASKYGNTYCDCGAENGTRDV